MKKKLNIYFFLLTTKNQKNKINENHIVFYWNKKQKVKVKTSNCHFFYE